MKKYRIMLIIILSIVIVYIGSWFLFGKDLLYEQSAKELLNQYFFLKFHKSEHIFIISKYFGKNVNHTYRYQINNKTIVNVSTKEEEKSLWEKDRERYKQSIFRDCFVEIDITKYNMLFSFVDSRYSLNDVNNEHMSFIWGIVGWIRIY